jgi:succinate dehydrogenase/fumarate reductase flavoprotein subunit
MALEYFDVIVVGGGNAAMSAALSAREQGASVAVLERSPQEERGGNSSYTAGSMRFAYNEVGDLQSLMPELAAAEWENYEFPAYPADVFFQDIAASSQYRTDPVLSEILVRDSFAAAKWLHSYGVRFLPYRRQAAKVGAKIKWFGGLVVETVGGGIGLTDAEYRAAERAGIHIFYETAAVSIARHEGSVCGVRVRRDGRESEMPCKAVVLACGGFEANAEWRTRYLGPGWDLAKVRGCRYNQGDGIRMASSWARRSPETGPDVTQRPGTATRRPTVTGRLASSSASTVFRSGSSSTRKASVSLTRVPIFTSTRMRDTDNASCASPVNLPGRYSMRKPSTCFTTNIASSGSRKSVQIRSKAW